VSSLLLSSHSKPSLRLLRRPEIRVFSISNLRSSVRSSWSFIVLEQGGIQLFWLERDPLFVEVLGDLVLYAEEGLCVEFEVEGVL